MARPKAATCPTCGRAAHARGVEHRSLKPPRYLARYSDPDGGRHSASFQGIKDAEAWLTARRAEIDAGTWRKIETKPRKGAALFETYAATWVSTRMVKGRPLAARTVATYEDMLDRFINPTFGPMALDQITREGVREWYAATAPDKPTTRARAFSLLRAIMATAADDELIEINPVRLKGAGQTERRHTIDIPTPAKIQELADAMPQRYRAMILLAAWTGLRFGELTELRRSDVVLVKKGRRIESGTIHVRRAVVAVKGEFQVKTPKSAAGIRDVEIPPHLLQAVSKHLLTVAPGADALLFPARSDPSRHLRPSTLQKVFKRAAAKVELPNLRVHDLRHFGATTAARVGASVAELQARLGHSTTVAAMRYQHAAKGRDAEIAKAMSELAKAK